MPGTNAKFDLIYDEEQWSTIKEDLLPLANGVIATHQPFESGKTTMGDFDRPLLLYLSSKQIVDLLSRRTEKEPLCAVLPHPEAQRVAKNLGVASSLSKAVDHLTQSEIEPLDFDLLFCNETPVFSAVVIGHSFQIATSHLNEGAGTLQRVRYFIRRLLRLRFFELQIVQKEDQIFKTSVAGVFVVKSQSSSMLRFFVPADQARGMRMFNAFMIAPRSIWEVLTYGLKSFLGKSQLPRFGAHIKSTELMLKAGENETLELTIDGQAQSAKEVKFEVRKENWKIFPGGNFEQPEEEEGGKEIYKVDSLPTGEVAGEMKNERLPFLRRASTEEFKDLFLVLRDNARLKNTYLTLMVLSTILATFGLFGNSAPVVIGAMILAPLMSPIISLSMATLRQEKKLAIDSAYTILSGLAVSFLFAVGITLFTPIHTAGSEIMSRISPNLLDLGIAVASGVAGAYAHAREEVAKTLAGVAIAVALVPPLAVSGIGLGWLDWEIFSGSILLLFTNLAGMVLAAAITFLLLGYSPIRIPTRGMLISFVIVLLLSIPLALGFQSMVYEHDVRAQLDGWETQEVKLRDVRVLRTSPLRLSVKLVSEHSLSEEELQLVKRDIEHHLGQEVQIEMTLALER